MFEAKLPNASLLKKIVDAIKDLVNDAPFDCTENSMSLQVIEFSWAKKFLFEGYPHDFGLIFLLSPNPIDWYRP